MKQKIEEFLTWAESNNWEIKREKRQDEDVFNKILNRYKKIPDEFVEFLRTVDVCVMPDEKSWFLCFDDYAETSDLAFRWNEFENMSLDSAEDDNELKKNIIEYWDTHLPFALSVRNDYAYYALDVGTDFGAVVFGYEPEFEEYEKVAPSFLDFLYKIMNNEIVF